MPSVGIGIECGFWRNCKTEQIWKPWQAGEWRREHVLLWVLEEWLRRGWGHVLVFNSQPLKWLPTIVESGPLVSDPWPNTVSSSTKYKVGSRYVLGELIHNSGNVLNANVSFHGSRAARVCLAASKLLTQLVLNKTAHTCTHVGCWAAPSTPQNNLWILQTLPTAHWTWQSFPCVFGQMLFFWCHSHPWLTLYSSGSLL